MPQVLLMKNMMLLFMIYMEQSNTSSIWSRKTGKAEKKYGYSPKNMLDSVENELLKTVDQYVQDAKKLLEDKQIIEASVKIQEI